MKSEISIQEKFLLTLVKFLYTLFYKHYTCIVKLHIFTAPGLMFSLFRQESVLEFKTVTNFSHFHCF